MEWIKWCKGLAKRPEVLRMAHKLQRDRKFIAATCMEVWEWVDSETTDGRMESMTPDIVDAIAELTGFASAMTEAGWLVQEESGIRFPDWKKHNHETAKKRAENAKRQANFRARHSRYDKDDPPLRKALPTIEPQERREEPQKKDGMVYGRGDGVSIHGTGGAGGGRRKSRHVEIGDLRDPQKLRELFLKHADTGVFARSEDQWFLFVTRACACLRVGNKPLAMFAASLRDWERKSTWVRIEDERAAEKIVKAWSFDT